MGNYHVRFGGERIEKESPERGENLARRLPNNLTPKRKIPRYLSLASTVVLQKLT